MSVVTTSGFTSSMINELKTGADSLTSADMNEEGANMLMLRPAEPRRNLTEHGFQSAQAVMRLF
jgi:hypothetical protein